jgi:ATP-binding cassette, subfamily C, bacterial CydD
VPGTPASSNRAPGSGPFDRRLLRRAAARWALAADVAAGLLGTILLLTQVTVLAEVIAAAVQDGLGQVQGSRLAVLAAIVLARAALARVVEVSGRKAATRVMSALRADLVGQRLRPRAGDLGGIGGAELAAGAVQGVEGLETYFARYLPQVVLAVTVPVAVLLWSAVFDPISALIMLLTLPVVPVLLALIGRSAGARSRANWEALASLSSHFLDVVRGLPTLRAYNRGQAQVERIHQVTDRYRRTTMGTLRLSFLSGIVLDLAATVSTALVAVDLGIRLVGGTIGLRAALTVLLLVPELYVSAGQRQRLGLARALLRDARLLVLDEPTVHLDEAAALQVAETVAGLGGARTVLLITHDPSLAARAGRLLWLDHGRAVEPPGVASGPGPGRAVAAVVRGGAR